MRNPTVRTTPSSANVITYPGTARARALALARGCYQRGLLEGREALSGAGLRGKAQKWSGIYAQSRAHLLERMTDAGIPWCERRGPHGKRVLVIGRRS